MDSSNKAVVKNQTALQIANYNPWNLLFSPRRRTESENSGTSTTSNYQTNTQLGTFQKQTSKNNDEYLWMIWRS
ncbi:unnamed protein product, partial [Brenthis ino]